MLIFLLACAVGSGPAEKNLSQKPAEKKTLVPAAPLPELVVIREQPHHWGVWRSRPLYEISGFVGKGFPGPADPSLSSILVIASAGGQESLYRASLLDGTAQLLAPAATQVRNPVWSPDGRWVYVSADWHRNQSVGPGGKPGVSLSPEIYRVPAKGGEPGRLTVSVGGSFEPDISPDGSKLVLGRSTATGTDIFWMNADGSGLTQFTSDPNEDIRPHWLGNDRLLWISFRSGAARIWVAPLNHPEQARLLREGGLGTQDTDFVVSPDQKRVAVTVQDTTGGVSIHLIMLENPESPVVLDGPGPDEHPAFARDGRLAFTSSRGGGPEVWVVEPDGSGLARAVAREEGESVWLPRWVQ